MRWIFVTALAACAAPVCAQTLQYYPFGSIADFLPNVVGQPAKALPPPAPINGPAYVPLTLVSPNNTVVAGTVSLSSIIDGATSASLAAIAAQLSRNQRDMRRLSESITMSSALTIIPPAAGDRYSLTVGAGGQNSTAALAISASARLTDQVLVYGAISRSATQTGWKGGASLSFR